ncbi:MAG: hypothetical protein WA393_08600 [Nitrososphaeraceae archaeon]
MSEKKGSTLDRPIRVPIMLLQNEVKGHENRIACDIVLVIMDRDLETIDLATFSKFNKFFAIYE